jgi:hypothetical protein
MTRRLDPADALMIAVALYTAMPSPERAARLAEALDDAPAGRGPAFDALVEACRAALAPSSGPAVVPALIAANRAAVDAPSRRWPAGRYTPEILS